MSKIVFSLFVPLLLSISSLAQVTFHITQVPKTTPGDAELFISGDFEGWTGGSTEYQLSKIGEQQWAITLDQGNGTIQYKFTRGSWASVEKDENGNEIGNRTFTFGGNGDTVEVAILNWADLSSEESTAAANVSILSEDFYIPQLDRTRRVWVYVPPDYDSTQTRYPVLYMHDGQNCFDQRTSFAGEWEVDETLNALYAEEGFSLIVVAVDNGGGHRIDEYTPWVNPTYGGGEGAEYIDFLSSTLKPHIDSVYRTLPEAENTGLMGSSLGGLISHYGALSRPDIFQKSGVFSSAFWIVADSAFAFGHENANHSDMRMYLLAGGAEGGNIPEHAQAMMDTMISGGFPEENITLKIDPVAGHGEAFWRREFGTAVKWLFDEVSAVTLHRQGDAGQLITKVYPNPSLDSVTIEYEGANIIELNVFDVSGRLINSVRGRSQVTVDVSELARGLYTLQATDGKITSSKKLLVQ